MTAQAWQWKNKPNASHQPCSPSAPQAFMEVHCEIYLLVQGAMYWILYCVNATTVFHLKFTCAVSEHN